VAPRSVSSPPNVAYAMARPDIAPAFSRRDQAAARQLTLLEPSRHAPLTRGIDSGPGAGPSSLFSLFPERGNGAPEAPGALRSAPRPALRSASLRAKLRPTLEGGGVPSARALAKSPAPPDAPSAHALSAAAPCSVIKRRDRRRPQLSKALGLYARTCEWEVNSAFARSFNTERGKPRSSPTLAIIAGPAPRSCKRGR